MWTAVSAADRAAAFRTACRLFRGFDLLPEATVESLRGFPQFFVARRGALSLREREIIARAITGEPPGSFGGDPRAIEDEARRGSRSLEAAPELSGTEQQLADFAAKITRRWSSLSLADVGQLLHEGYSPAAVREATDVALVFRVIHRLTMAVSAHVPVGTRPVRANALAAAAGARAGRPRARSAPDSDEDEEAALWLPAAPLERHRNDDREMRGGLGLDRND